MAIDLKKYQQLKDKVDQHQRDADRAAGALEQLMVQLKDKFGCKTLNAAKAKATILEEEAEAAEGVYNRALAEFEKELASATVAT
jgi:hypothetical protein